MIAHDHESATPTPLTAPGVIIFGMTALVVGLFATAADLSAAALAALTFCGGAGLIAVAALDWRRQNLFSAIVFVSYGLFCLSLIPLVILPRAGQAAPQTEAMAAYLFIWGLFSIVLFRTFARNNRSMRLMFGLLVSFLLLSATAAATQSLVVQTAAGYAGIVFGIDAVAAGCVLGRGRRRAATSTNNEESPS